MYYPLLRGRQNELLAIQELMKGSVLSEKVIPVIEPVKLSPTLVNTIESFNNSERSLLFIRNPKVGSFYSDLKNPKNTQYKEKLVGLLKGNIHPQRGVYVNQQFPDAVSRWLADGVSPEEILAICLHADDIRYFNDADANTEMRIAVPYAPAFRRVGNKRILIEDSFNKRQRNADYSEEKDEFFSENHLYFSKEGYIGFSDYSIIGKEYSESGFTPHAVAIHIVYFDSQKVLRVRHFVSDDKDDASDPGGKFYQALGKLIEWNNQAKLDTIGIRRFAEIYEAQTYPGLGVVKKLSIMHHLELMSRFMDGEI